MHTPVETAHRDDLDKTAALLAQFIRGLGEEVPNYAL
jgi:putative aminopeptidase FrvX